MQLGGGAVLVLAGGAPLCPWINVGVEGGQDGPFPRKGEGPLTQQRGCCWCCATQQRVSQHTRGGCSTPCALPGLLPPVWSGTRCSKHTSVYKVFLNNAPDIAPREVTDPDECKGHLLSLALVSPGRGGSFAAVSLLQRKGRPSCWPAWCHLGNAAGGSRHPCSQEPRTRAATRIYFLLGGFSGHFHVC